MKLSVVIPTFNRRNVIMNAVNSVLAQKSSLKFEIVISDDGSSDNTEDLFKKKDKRVKYVYNKVNRGVNVARNIGIKKASGDFIVFLDSDDVLTPDCFAVLEQYADKLQEVNLFGTAEIKSRRKMFHIAEERSYSYREWLEEKNIGGEFLSVVNRDVFKKDLFDEERFCFERFFWNRVIKRYGCFAVPRVLRLYSFEEENRVSRKLVDPKYAERRYNDYIEYVKRFGPDYEALGLKKKYSEVLLRVGLFGVLGRVPLARDWIKKSLSFSFSLQGFVLLVLSCFGAGVTRTVYRIVLLSSKQ